MAKSLFICVLSITINLVYAQSTHTLMGARSAGMGYASSGNHDNWSIFNNPGGLGIINKSTAAFAYEARPWLMGANRMAAAFNATLRKINFSAGMYRFGDDLYSEQLISAGIGNQFGITSLGLKMNVVQYRSDGLGVFHAFSLDFGGITELTPKLLISAYITNLNRAKINHETGERIPTLLTAGLTFRADKHFFITSELMKDLDYLTTWRTGMEYILKEKVFFRTGFNLNPNAAFFGVGGKKKNIQLDYAIQFNSITGPVHQASASYIIDKINAKK